MPHTVAVEGAEDLREPGNGGLRSAVVVNPVKVPQVDELRHTVDEALTAAGWPEPQWYHTTVEDPGCGQTRKAIQAGAELVFACGGDGTVMSCVNGLVSTDVALAVLPCGTGNLLAANLGLSNDLAAALEVAIEQGRRRLDVGMVGDQCFTVMAGMGFDAQMLATTSEATKAWIGWPAYLTGAVRHLRDRPMRVWIRIDDGPALRRRERVPRMEVFRVKQVRITSSRVQPRELDGDLIEPGRVLNAEVRPAALWLCVPRPEQAPDLAVDAEAAGERGERLVEEAR